MAYRIENGLVTRILDVIKILTFICNALSAVFNMI